VAPPGPMSEAGHVTQLLKVESKLPETFTISPFCSSEMVAAILKAAPFFEVESQGPAVLFFA
jgi:hypothetical protein